MKTWQRLLISMIVAGLLAGCASQSPYTYGGAAVGGALGAGTGALVSPANPWLGAAIGGTAGALLGGFVGDAYGRQQTQPGAYPGYAPSQPSYGYTQPQPGYTQPQPGYAQPQPGYVQPQYGGTQPQYSYTPTPNDNYTGYTAPPVNPNYTYGQPNYSYGPQQAPTYRPAPPAAGPGGPYYYSN